MPGRVEGKVAIVVGAGQTPGATIGSTMTPSILALSTAPAAARTERWVKMLRDLE